MIALLLKELKKFTEQLTETLTFGETRERVSVHLGCLPVKKAPKGPVPPVPDPESEFPYIIIQALDGEDLDRNGTAQIKFLLGTKSKDDDGYLDVIHLIETIRLDLLRTGIIGGRFEIQRPLQWTLFEEQPYPEWIGEIRTTWTTPAIIREVDDFE
ncbi:hypothetical protein YDYSY3_57860 [Paenibacillus chitinolyticus]|uniref:hypothetical protein n=1 Tax=Paenibacillus chitinolyticus TaxID=79263 RepID=UPI0026E4CF66|nr:hypothetical protein [Paenibacillus chitinolyticus]GKS14786.1 hypothetical protein YDYSY3_57860 [Paenibacillus chitinolyticus]